MTAGTQLWYLIMIMIMTWTGLVWSGLSLSGLLNITRCKSQSDPAVIRPLRLRAGIHHVSQQEQDVDILNTLTLTSHYVQLDQDCSGLFILDLMVIFNNNIRIKACIFHWQHLQGFQWVNVTIARHVSRHLVLFTASKKSLPMRSSLLLACPAG